MYVYVQFQLSNSFPDVRKTLKHEMMQSFQKRKTTWTKDGFSMALAVLCILNIYNFMGEY